MRTRNRIGIMLSYRLARARIFKLSRSPGIDSKESIPPAYAAWLSGTTTLYPTRFLAPIDCLQIPAQATYSWAPWKFKNIVSGAVLHDKESAETVSHPRVPAFLFFPSMATSCKSESPSFPVATSVLLVWLLIAGKGAYAAGSAAAGWKALPAVGAAGAVLSSSFGLAFCTLNFVNFRRHHEGEKTFMSSLNMCA
jgi:hypothetical protein